MVQASSIVIFGLYKTGTTALFHSVKSSLDSRVRTLFEAEAYHSHPNDDQKGVLAKVILDNTGRVDYSGFFKFDKKLILVRDPRDWLISGTLFILQQRAEIYTRPSILAKILELLEQKEQKPQSVSLVGFLEHIFKFLPEQSPKALFCWTKEILDWAISFHQTLPGACTVRYEDFVEGRTSQAKQYLGHPITFPIEVPAEHRHVPRTRASGNWKDWFTPEDVSFFQPLLQTYMTYHHYEDDWTLRDSPSIQPEHASGYVKRTTALRLERST